MSAWVPFTDDTFTNALPVDFLSQHAAWVAAHPSKALRLTEIVTGVRNNFRSAVESNPRNVMDPDEITVPATGELYAFTVAAYTLGLEMGLTSTASAQGAPVVNLIVATVSSGGVAPLAATPATATATGLNFLDELGRRIVRAEIWLRLVQSGVIPILSDDVGGTPTYRGPEVRCQRSEARI